MPLSQRFHTPEWIKLGPYLHRFGQRRVWAAFLLVNGFVSIGLLAALAVVTRTSFVFPSLGPTAFLFFFNPHVRAASPRNAIIGHAIGLCCGYAALLLFGLQHAGSATLEGVTWPRAGAAAFSLATTAALMVLFRAAHPPAGATTLIVSLGFIVRPSHLVVIEAAVVVLALQAVAINRLAGLDFPFWENPPSSRRGRRQHQGPSR